MRELFINAAPGETRIALRENGRLCAFEIERDYSLSILGNIYLGRVEKIVSGIQAAFIDIGTTRSGFLALPETRPANSDVSSTKDRLEDYINEGDTVCVQVLRDAISDKGPKLTTHIKLPGCFLVLMLNNDQILASRRIRKGDSERLQEVIESSRETSEGYIIRTAAEGATEDDIIRDMKRLREQWINIQEKCKKENPPSSIFNELPPIFRNIRDGVGNRIARIVVDDPQKLKEIKNFCEEGAPDSFEKIELHTESTPIFEANDIEEEIEIALASQITLVTGARIHIEQTAALTAIDIDSASASQTGGHEKVALDVNLAAAREIFHQLRLRNIGGHIIIDFLPMRNRQNKEQLLSLLRKEFQEDPCPVFIAGFTRLGKVELSRQRQRESWANLLLVNTSEADLLQRPKSTATIAFEVLRCVQREFKANPGKSFELKAAPSVIAMLQKGVAKKGLDQLTESLGGPIMMTAQEGLVESGYEVVAYHGDTNR